MLFDDYRGTLGLWPSDRMVLVSELFSVPRPSSDDFLVLFGSGNRRGNRGLSGCPESSFRLNGDAQRCLQEVKSPFLAGGNVLACYLPSACGRRYGGVTAFDDVERNFRTGLTNHTIDKVDVMFDIGDQRQLTLPVATTSFAGQ